MSSKVLPIRGMHEPKGPVLVLWQADLNRDEWVRNAFAEVQGRLDEYIKGGFVRLEILGEEGEALRTRLRALLSRDNWERWERHGWVPPEWELAKRGERREVSVVFVSNKSEVLEAQLNSLQKIMRSDFPGFEVEVAVVWAGSRLPKDSPKVSMEEFKRRLKVWVGPVAVGGEKVSDTRRQHTLSTLLVAFASTDWGRSFPVDEENWWAVGTSSIVVDYNALLRLLVSEVVRALVGKISTGITPEQEAMLRRSAREKIEETKKRWAKDIEAVLGTKGWECKVNYKEKSGIYISPYYFIPKPLHPILNGSYGENETDGKAGAGHLFTRLWRGVVNTVEYYIDVMRLWMAARSKVRAERISMEERWGNEYKEIYESLYEKLRLDKRENGKADFFGDLPKQIGYLVNRTRGSASLLVPQKSQNRVLPIGVEAAKVWVDELWKGIFSAPWVDGESHSVRTVKEISELGMRVQPDDWRNKGSTDVSWLENYWRWYLREQEAFMYPEVAILKGAISWPMLYAGLILFKPDMQGIRGWLISLSILLLLLIAELIWRWQKKERMIVHLWSRSREFLRLQIQGIIGKAVRKALLSGERLAWLYVVRKALKEYVHSVRDYLGEFIEEPKSSEEENVYWLVDGSDNGVGAVSKEEVITRVIAKADIAAAEGQINLKCWKGMNVNAPSEEYEGILALIMERLVERLLNAKEGEAKGKASALILWDDVLKCLEEVANKYVREVVGNFEDLIYILPEQINALREGRKWAWLWERAYPLGKVLHASHEFTTMIVPNRFSLLGPEGVGSRFWDDAWNVAHSILPYEISCIRGVRVSSVGKKN